MGGGCGRRPFAQAIQDMTEKECLQTHLQTYALEHVNREVTLDETKSLVAQIRVLSYNKQKRGKGFAADYPSDMTQQRKGGRTSAISRAEHSPAAPWLGAVGESLRETAGRGDASGDRRHCSYSVSLCVTTAYPGRKWIFFDEPFAWDSLAVL